MSSILAIDPEILLIGLAMPLGVANDWLSLDGISFVAA